MEIPLYETKPRYDAYLKWIIGGVLVCPGDVVVGDGDGVIVVPRAVAEPVAKYALKILEGDKQGRRHLYESMGMPLDKTVK